MCGVDLAKVPPSNHDAEQAVLAAILARPVRVREAAEVLVPGAFYSPIHRTIFTAMLELDRHGIAADLVTLGEILTRQGKLDEVGGPVYLAEIASGFVGNFPEHVRIIKDLAARREIITAGYALLDAAHDLGRDLAEATKHATTAAKATELQRRDPGRAFSFIPLSGLLSAPRPTKWLVRGHLEAGCLAALIGEPGSMKSFLAIDMGLCIASNTPWHGLATPNPGPVFYLAGEGFHGLGKRIKAWITAHGADPAAVPFFVSSSPAQLLDAAHACEVADAVASLAEQHGPPRLVVVDTLNRNFGPGDENSSADMTAFVAALDTLKARFGCAVVVVHHSGLTDKGRARGSTVLKAALDFEYLLALKRDARVLTCSKCKDHEPPQPLAFEPEEVGTGWTDPATLQEITSCVLRLTDLPEDDGSVKLTGPQQIALDALRDVCEAAGGPAHVNEWRRRAYELGISAGESSARKKAFSRATRELAKAELVHFENGLWFPTAGGQRGHQGDMSLLSPGHRGGQGGHPSLEGVPCPLACPLPEEEFENPFAEASHG